MAKATFKSDLPCSAIFSVIVYYGRSQKVSLAYCYREFCHSKNSDLKAAVFI